MPKTLRELRSQLEPLSWPALKVLHVLEPVVGRIIATAMLKHACEKSQLDPAQLEWSQIEMLLPVVADSLGIYDRSTEVIEELRGLTTTAQTPGGRRE